MADDWSYREDARPASSVGPRETATGERYWVLTVTLHAGRNWPADSVTRLFIWQERDHGEIWIDHGRYYPATTAQGDGDDGL